MSSEDASTSKLNKLRQAEDELEFQAKVQEMKRQMEKDFQAKLKQEVEKHTKLLTQQAKEVFEQEVKLEANKRRLVEFRGKLPKVEEDRDDLNVAIMYVVARAKDLLRNYSEQSVLSALEYCLPLSVTRRHNRSGSSNVTEFLQSLSISYNSVQLLEDEARKLENHKIQDRSSLMEEIVKFLEKVQDFNFRCELAGRELGHLKWTMYRSLAHINNALIPLNRRSYRADFASARFNLRKPCEELSINDVRAFLCEIEERQEHLTYRSSSTERVNAVEQRASGFSQKPRVCVRCDKENDCQGKFRCDCGLKLVCGKAGCTGNHLAKHHELVLSWQSKGQSGSRPRVNAIEDRLNQLEEQLRQV